MLTPPEIARSLLAAGESKARLPLGKMLLLAILAGAYIALAGVGATAAAVTVESGSLAKLLSACVFPAGLSMVILAGSELFTGNCLIVMDVVGKKVTWFECIRNLIVVYFSNLIGALIIDTLIYFSGNLDYTGGLLGAYAIKVAVGKVGISPLKGITSGILCNILVCIAILMAAAATDIVGKIWAIFFPIMAFVVGGFEHCVANMFYIPVGMMAAQNPAYVAKAQEAYGLTAEQIQGLTVLHSLNNFIPVTIGNILGGMVFVGIPCYFIYKKKWQKWHEESKNA